MDDIIKKVKYSHTKDVVLVELKKSNFTVEFRNGKKNRAEIVKKMKLSKGEPVIIVGAKSDVSDLYVFGWDIKREGFINTGAYSIVRGTLEKIAGIRPYWLPGKFIICRRLWKEDKNLGD